MQGLRTQRLARAILIAAEQKFVLTCVMGHEFVGVRLCEVQIAGGDVLNPD